MNDSIASLTRIAAEIRKSALQMVHYAGSGHPGGALSAADILAVLYFKELRITPEEPGLPERDRFVLSKGHSCPALYAALGLRGYFPTDEFTKLRRLGCLLEGHPDVKIPGVDAPSGSLGMGLSQGLGMALGARYTKRSFRTYVLLGDGDMEEGNTWEALMACGHYRLDTIAAILDANGLQGEDRVEKQMDYFPVAEKVRAFRWHVIEIDGHDIPGIIGALDEARGTKGRPTFIVAKTVKGKGVSFMENVAYWHGSVGITKEQLDIAFKELGG